MKPKRFLLAKRKKKCWGSLGFLAFMRKDVVSVLPLFATFYLIWLAFASTSRVKGDQGFLGSENTSCNTKKQALLLVERRGLPISLFIRQKKQ